MPMIISVLLACLAALVTPNAAFAQSTADSSAESSKPLRVLFIGNSYTYYNNLPSILVALAAASGDLRIEVKSETKGGATLLELGGYGMTKQVISEGGWDFIVLQEQSVLPITYPEKMYRGVRELDARIKKVNAKTVLYLTWARRSSPETQKALDQAYYTVGKELGARVAPVGPAWQVAQSNAPDIPLYNMDGSHPSATGSYLAACVLYLTIVPDQAQCPAIELEGMSAENGRLARNAATAVMATVGNR